MKPNSRNGIGEKTSKKTNGSMSREKLAKENNKILVNRAQSSSTDP